MHINDISEQSLRRRRGEKWTQYPSDVLPAWVADMDYRVADPIREALDERIAAGDLGYPVSPSRSGLRELFCERVAARFGWAVSAQQVVVINDVVQGLYLALQTFSEPGDGVIIQTPIYPPFLKAAKQTGRRAVVCPLRAGQSAFEIDFDQFERAIDASTRVIALCNPHNPCGRAFAREELERIAEIAVRHDLVIVSDEIHADLVLDDTAHIPIASLSDAVAQRTLTLMSASKAFNIAGLCMAFAHFGSAELQARFERIPGHSRGGTNTLSVAAVTAAWREAQDWQNEVLQTLRNNRARVAAFVAEHWPDVRHFPPQATYLAWLDMRQLNLPTAPQAFLLEHARVALSDGKAFGPEGEGFVRLNFATSPDILEQILLRMQTALDAHAGK